MPCSISVPVMVQAVTSVIIVPVCQTNHRLINRGSIVSILKNQKPFSSFFVDDVIVHSNLNPLTVKTDVSIRDAIKLMGEREIWDLPVVDEKGTLKGLLHLHNAISKFIEN